MARIWLLIALVATASCEASNNAPPAPAAPKATPAGAVDDGTYLQQIDPLGGQWEVEHIGEENFQPFKAWVNFSAGGFLNHGAGRSGDLMLVWKPHWVEGSNSTNHGTGYRYDTHVPLLLWGPRWVRPGRIATPVANERSANDSLTPMRWVPSCLSRPVTLPRGMAQLKSCSTRIPSASSRGAVSEPATLNWHFPVRSAASSAGSIPAVLARNLVELAERRTV